VFKGCVGGGVVASSQGYISCAIHHKWYVCKNNTHSKQAMLHTDEELESISKF